MYCKNCGKQNDDNNKFCVNCGQALTTDNQSFFQSSVNRPHPEQHIFDTPEVQRTERADSGFFIIALLMLLNIAIWFVWSWATGNRINGHESLYKIVRVFSVFILIAQFVTSFIFVKKEIYKTIIVIVGLLCAAYYIYYLIDDFKHL
jgi:hypothetical protein